MSERSIDQRLLGYSARSRAFLAAAIVAGFGAAGLAVAFAVVLSDVIARVFVDHDAIGDVAPMLWALLAIAIGRGALMCAHDGAGQVAANALKSAIQADTMSRIRKLGPTYTSGERSGELSHALGGGVEELDEYVAAYRPARALAVAVPLLVAAIVFAIDRWTVLILLATGPLLLVFLALIGRRTGEITARRFAELGWLSASFLDMLQGLPTLKMFGRSREQLRYLRETGEQYSKATMDVLRTAFETSLVLELSASLATALVAVEISLRLLNGDVGFARALAVLVITPEFFLPLRHLATKYHAGAAGRAAGERLFAILDAGAERSDRQGRAAPVAQAAEIALEHVSFAYGGGRAPALEDVSLRLRRGTVTALVGPSGAGKSTIVNLLLAFERPDAGAVLVDGRDLRDIDIAAWRAGVAWVPQRPQLFAGTVAENIRMARPGATDDDVIAAAKAAAAHEFVLRLPRGYGTEIGERGAMLSGGERQRIAIARAFLKDAPLLILDEATSQLDAEHEEQVRESVSRLARDRTVLVIAHRAAMVRGADQTIEIAGGRVVTADARSEPEAGERIAAVASAEAGGAT